MSNLNEDQFGSYRMQHQPDPTGSQMHEAENAFPDVHEHPEYYHSEPELESRSISVIRRTKGDPEARVSVYRAVPKGVTRINHGDWVTPSKPYAQRHGIHPYDPKQDMPVIHKLVKAKDLRTEGNSVSEWGYFPEKHP
jgi:hypothetical protein